MAVAVTPELDIADGLTLEETAAALLNVGYNPDAGKLMRPWSINPFISDPILGIFHAVLIRHFLKESQPAPLLAWFFETGNFSVLFHSNSDRLEQLTAILSDLYGLSLPKDATPLVVRSYSAMGNVHCSGKLSKNLRDSLDKRGLNNKIQASYLPKDAYKELTQEIDKLLEEQDFCDEREKAEIYELLGSIQWINEDFDAAQSTWSKVDIDQLPLYDQNDMMLKTLFGKVPRNNDPNWLIADLCLRYLLADQTD